MGIGLQWIGIGMRHKGTDRGHEEATSKCRRGMKGSRGGVDVQGAWVYLLVFEVDSQEHHGRESIREK